MPLTTALGQHIPHHNHNHHHHPSLSPSLRTLHHHPLVHASTPAGDIMFRPFSFDAASPHLPEPCLETRHAALHVSPTSTAVSPPSPEQTRLPTPPPCSVGELAHRLRRQNLCVDINASFRIPVYEPLTPPSDDIALPSDVTHSFSPEASLSSMSPAAIRSQRQANTRLQCSESHIRDISVLVEKMIEQRDQCSVSEPASSPPPATSPIEVEEEDEGVDMEYDAPNFDQPRGLTLKFRRSGDRLNGQTAVSKSVRMRKSKVVKRRSSR